MEQMEQMVHERRKFARFSIEEGAFVITSGLIGNIVDISLEGLAFKYMKLHDSRQGSGSVSGRLDILFNGQTILEGIPYRDVSDNIMENKFVTSPMVVKRQSVRFRNLSSQQRNTLRDFIRSHCRPIRFSGEKGVCCQWASCQAV